MTVLEDLFSGDDERAAAAAERVSSEHLPELEAAVNRPDPDARWWAVRALAQIPSEAATAALLRTLADADSNVVAAAAYALGQRSAPEAVTPLLPLTAHESEYLARLATDALVHIGRPAVPALVQALQQEASPRLRGNAARALAFIGETSAIPALFKALEDESALVQYWAEEGLDRMGVGQVYFKPG